MAKYLFEDGLKLRQKVRAVVIDKSGRVLLVRPNGYSSEQWTLAGGGVEEGEHPQEAILRELAEELGLREAERLTQLAVSNRFVYPAEYKQKRSADHDGQQAVMFACEVPTGTQLHLQAEELADARWFTPEEAVEAFPVPRQRAIFLACMAELHQRTRTAAGADRKRA